MSRLLFIVLTVFSYSTCHAEMLHLLCSGEKLSPNTRQWEAGWTQSFQIDMEKKQLVEYNVTRVEEDQSHLVVATVTKEKVEEELK